MATLFTLAEGIRKCSSCPLYKSRIVAVPGEGSVNAKVMFIGEAPGNEEDRIGQPFVGRSGKYLDLMLKKIGLSRNDVFITGAVKCHPLKNRTPLALELKTCTSLWLTKQIDVLHPQIIVLLGATAVKAVLPKIKVSESHGTVIVHENKSYFVTYHPSSAMRFPAIRKLMEEDFSVLQKEIR